MSSSKEKKEYKDNIVKYIHEKVVFNIINYSLINNNDKIVIGVSGGPDSMCLLNTLIDIKSKLLSEYGINYTIYVAHVNHMIREESKTEKEYVYNFCKKHDIPFFYHEEDVVNNSKKAKMSEETYGRKIRYDFYDEVLLKTNSNLIATAHNLNDDIETIMLNLIRGTGLDGLTGMNFKYNNIIRPILNIEKKDILEYNEKLMLNPCIDKTNFENIYSRNKVRNILIPLLEKEYNSNFKQNIVRMKNILSKDNDFIEKYTQDVYNKIIIEKNCSNENDNKINIKFNIKLFLLEDECIKSRLIRHLITEKNGNLDGVGNVHINDVIKLLNSNIKGKKYIFGNKFTFEIIRKNIGVIY